MSKKKDSLKPWLSRPAINRSVTLPLTRPLTQRLSNLNEFHPNELDPYLLFDARDSMIGTLENPTLDLDPSKPDTLNVITATRAGVATFTDVNGNIASAPANTVRVDYTQGAELTPAVFQRVKYTDFSQLWSGGNGTITDGQGFSGNNSKIITGTSASGFIDTSVATEDGVTYTGSVYIRRLSGTGGIEFTAYSSASSDVTPVITDTIGTDFVRVSFQFLGKSGGGNVFFGIKIQQSGDSVEIAMPQVEEGTTPTTFVANTTGSPKFITGPTFGPRVPMILVEPSSENLVDYSEDFSQSVWNTGSASVTTDYGYLSPSGDLTATKVTKQNTSGHLYTSENAGAKSIFIKGTAGETVATLDRHTDPNTLITLTGEWQRVELNGINNLFYAVDFRAGTATEVYIWGAQVEAGSVSTSYIPTSGGDAAARTRAADDLVISGSAFSDFYNQSEGTFYAEFEPRELSTSITNTAFELSNGTGAERILSHVDSQIHAYFVDGGNVQANLDGGTNTVGVLNRLALSYKANNIQVSVSGGAVVSDTSASIPTVDRLIIGNQVDDTTRLLNGHVKRFIYWPYHSDNL